jgi:hypothetical protein
VDAAGDVGGKLGVARKLLDECAKDLLSGDARESEAVSGFSLPDVEGSVCGRGEVHGSSCPLAASWLVEFLTDVRQAFGRRRTVGMRGWFGAERRGAGFHAAGGNLLFGVDLSTSGHKYVRHYGVPHRRHGGLALQAPNGGAEHP